MSYLNSSRIISNWKHLVAVAILENESLRGLKISNKFTIRYRRRVAKETETFPAFESGLDWEAETPAVIDTQIETPSVIGTQIESPAVIDTQIESPAVIGTQITQIKKKELSVRGWRRRMRLILKISKEQQGHLTDQKLLRVKP